MSLILASSSPYRRQLLAKIHLHAEIVPPDINEEIHPNEIPRDAAKRLSEAKAMAVAQSHSGLIIASDQVASVDGIILGKPYTEQNAIKQLKQCTGKRVTFFTGVCLYNSQTNTMQSEVIPYTVYFRSLTDSEIRSYVMQEMPLDCAGSFKSEGLGVTLFEKMEGEDPNALVGLPLIALCRMLRNEGINPIG